MDSVGPDCRELKQQYDECFNTWFTEQFLAGHTEEDPKCLKLFEVYSACVNKAIKEKGINIEEIQQDLKFDEEK